MSFIWPAMLISLLLLPLAVGLYIWLQRRRRQRLASVGSLGWAFTGGKSLGARRHIPPVLFLLGMALLLIALARPQMTVNLPRIEGTVILAFDVSGSMAAEDLEPTRMEAAKAIAREFVLHQPSTVQLGVVAFSESGLLVQAPTNDQAAVLSAIGRITPQRGTSLGQGILASLNTINGGGPATQPTEEATPTPEELTPNHSAVIVLLSDGENTAPPSPLEAAQAAAERGIRIYPVGVGSTTGATLHIEGFTVHTQLDEQSLQQIAQLTNGVYYNGTNQDDLRNVYQNLQLQLVIKPETTEVTALFVAIGSILLLVGGVCSLLWFSRMP